MDIFNQIAAFFAGIGMLISGVVAPAHTNTQSVQTTAPSAQSSSAANPVVQTGTNTQTADTSASSSVSASASAGPTVYTQAQLLAMASNKYANGTVPLGDSKYVTSGAKKGYVYLCNVHKDNPGSMVNGPWINGSSWNFLQKVSVDGSVSWPNATFSDVISGVTRVLSGNGLPISHNTGTFPVSKTSTAGKYDPNPNTISAQQLRESLPANPTYSATPYCMGGEVGIMLSGVPLFNGFDAGLRDAPAHELQDSCEGHPQGSGEYHYHSLSSCFKDISETTTLGFAYDGFPITGPEVAPGKYLTTENLDECHGLTSEIVVDGKKKTTYHYVMTQDFPYSASCFRGKPVTTGPSGGAPKSTQSTSAQTQAAQGGQQAMSNQQDGQQGMQPPQAAFAACSGVSIGGSCTFNAPNGTIRGACQTPPGQSQEACVPNNR